MGRDHDRAASAGAATGILLLNLGGPETQEAVEPFLVSLFSDREIIELPGGPAFQGAFARLIARVRGPKVRAAYRRIGGGSPILSLTRRQAEALERELNGEEPELSPSDRPGPSPAGTGDARRSTRSTRFRVGIAMRYRTPTTEEALEEMRSAGIGRIVALTLYPQYSAATTGSSLNALDRAAARMGGFHVTAIDRYPDHPGYLAAVAETVAEGLASFPREERASTVLLFSAHGLPVKFIRAGDPYVGEIARTRDGVLAILRARGIENRATLGYQSRTGPVRWIGPYTDAVIEELASEGVRNLLVVPIAFVSDHIETLYEIDLLFAEVARKAGILRFRRTRMLNDDPRFIAALADLARTHLRGGQPAIIPANGPAR